MWEWLVAIGADEVTVQLSSWGATIGAWIKESGLWVFEVLKSWALLVLSEWFTYILTLINVSDLPVISQLSGWVLVLNGFVPLDVGFQLFFAWLTIAVPVVAFRMLLSVIPFIG